jgi:hypothetical protein
MKYTQNRLKYTPTDSHPCSIAHSNVCTRLFGAKMRSDWCHRVEIVQGRWLHGEEVSYWYPCRLEKTFCKWDIYVPLVMKGLMELPFKLLGLEFQPQTEFRLTEPVSPPNGILIAVHSDILNKHTSQTQFEQFVILGLIMLSLLVLRKVLKLYLRSLDPMHVSTTL